MPSETYDQIALAAEQLDVALEIFLSQRSYVSALTLAGAAEEILGHALKRAGGQNAVQYAYEGSTATHRFTHGRELEWKVFVDAENYARNAAKHVRRDEATTVDIDLQRAAMWMIVRACTNFDRLDLERTDRMREFDNWFCEHEVGV